MYPELKLDIVGMMLGTTDFHSNYTRRCIYEVYSLSRGNLSAKQTLLLVLVQSLTNGFFRVKLCLRSLLQNKTDQKLRLKRAPNHFVLGLIH